MAEKHCSSLLETLKKKLKTLGPVDARSLQKILNTFTDFGDDFRQYRKTQLTGIPNTVIVSICRILNTFGYNICISRETERYNDIADLCIQQHWKSCLAHIFPNISFHKPQTVTKNKKYEFETLRALYTSAVQNYVNGSDFKMIENAICNSECNTVSFLAHLQYDNYAFIATFQKIGTIHSLLCYVTYRNGQIFIFDSRLKKIKKKIMQDNISFGDSLKSIDNIQELIDVVSKKQSFEKTFYKELTQTPAKLSLQMPAQPKDEKRTIFPNIVPKEIHHFEEKMPEPAFIFPSIPKIITPSYDMIIS